jgi:hypothetical protein
MSKTMTWHTRAMYILLALVLAVSLAMIAAPTGKVDAGTLKWTKVATPEENGSDNVIRQNSDIKDFVIASDGETIYAIGEMADGTPKLWKSTNGGASFSDKASKVAKVATFDEFSAVAVSPDDADFVAVAGNLSWRCESGYLGEWRY